MSPAATRRVRVLRVYHSGVVGSWRERDRQLIGLGADVTLIAPVRWNEGGGSVCTDPGRDAFVTAIRTFGRHPYRFIYGPLGLWRTLRSGSFDVIDIHEEPASLAAAEVQLLAWFANRRVPFCVYSAQNIAKRYPIPFRYLERITLSRAAAIHTCNSGAVTILRDKGYLGPIKNLGLGVEIQRFSPCVGRVPNADELRVGYLGRLESHKGVRVLVDAISTVDRATLDIVGEGPERVAIEGQIAGLGIGDRVRVVGFTPPEQVANVYRRFDVVAVPSLVTSSWIEQFCRVAVEAMAAGVPVIASECGALPEVLGKAGVLVPPGNRESLADALRRLANDPEERRRLSALGIQRARRYSWNSIAREQLALFREMTSAS